MLHVGDTLRDYRLLEEVHSGAAGTVYRAQHLLLPERVVAIKVVRACLSHDEDHHARLLNEGRLVDRVGSAGCPPSLVRLYEAGPLPEGGAFLVMEYLEGGSLREELRRRERGEARYTDDALLRLLQPIAEGLCFLHRQLGVVHLDVKPENILFTDRPAPCAKLVDFGIATAAQRFDQGRLLGTLGYIAPELLRDGEVSSGADVFSLGAVVYEVLCGDRPPEPARMRAELAARRTPTALAALVRRMLAASPERPRMEEVAAQLRDPGMATPPPLRDAPARGPRPPQRAERLGRVSACALLALLGLHHLAAGPPAAGGLPAPARPDAAERRPDVGRAATLPSAPPPSGQAQPRRGRSAAAPPAQPGSRACLLTVAPPVDVGVYLGGRWLRSLAREKSLRCDDLVGQQLTLRAPGYGQKTRRVNRGVNRVTLEPEE